MLNTRVSFPPYHKHNITIITISQRNEQHEQHKRGAWPPHQHMSRIDTTCLRKRHVLCRRNFLRYSCYAGTFPGPHHIFLRAFLRVTKRLHDLFRWFLQRGESDVAVYLPGLFELSQLKLLPPCWGVPHRTAGRGIVDCRRRFRRMILSVCLAVWPAWRLVRPFRQNWTDGKLWIFPVSCSFIYGTGKNRYDG